MSPLARGEAEAAAPTCEGASPGVGGRRPPRAGGRGRRGGGTGGNAAVSPATPIAPPSGRRGPSGAEALGAVGTRVTARLEDEARLGRGLSHEAGAAGEDEQAAVQAFPHLDAAARVGAAVWARRDLH